MSLNYSAFTNTKSNDNGLNYSAFGIQNKKEQTGNQVYQTINGKPSFALKPIQDTSTISTYQEPKSPFGFVGDMIKSAYRGIKGMIESTVKADVRAVDSLLARNKATVEEAKKNTLAPKYLKKRSSLLETGVNVGVGAVQTATTLLPAFQVFTAGLEAAKNLPGPAKIPAIAFSKIMEKMGDLGSWGINKGIDALPISEESKQAMRPVADEIAPLVAMMVGMKLVHGGMEKGMAKGLEKVKVKPKTSAKVSSGINFGVQLSTQPFSTAYGLVSSRIAQKVAERQQQGIEATPKEMRKVMTEVKQEIAHQGLPDIKKNGDISPEKPTVVSKPIIEQKTPKIKAEGQKTGIVEPLTIDIQKAKAEGKSFEEWWKGQDKVYHGANAKFDEFDLSKAKNTLYGKGLYFATTKKVANQYGKNVKEVYINTGDLLKLDKPLSKKQQMSLRKVMGKDEWDWDKKPTGNFVWGRLELTRKNPEKILKKAGIKGVIHKQSTVNGSNVNYVIFDESAIKTKSQLKELWDKTKVEKPVKTKKPEIKKIEPKAIEKNLTKGKDLSKIEKRTFEEESKKVADLINKDVNNVRAIVRGEKLTDIRAGAIIGGMEEYAKQHPKEAGDIIQELANSPLHATISTGASETSFARLKNESASSQLNEVKKVYEKKVNNFKEKKTKLKKSLKEETKKFNLSKEEKSLNNFLNKIIC